MKTFQRVCIEDYTVVDQKGTSFTLKRCQEYLTGPIKEDGWLIVFSSYWVSVPSRIFAGERSFT